MTSTPTDRAVPRWHRRKEARPGEILAAALTEFVERGYAATRLDDIARRAGVTKGTMYLYFENKEELFKAVVREHLRPLLAETRQLAVDTEGSARDVLERVLRARWRWMFETQLSGLIKVVMAEANAFPELASWWQAEVMQPSREIVGGVVRRGVDSGEFRSDLDPAVAARIAMSPIVLAALWKHSFLKCEPVAVDTQAWLEAWMLMLFDGLAAPAARGRS